MSTPSTVYQAGQEQRDPVGNNTTPSERRRTQSCLVECDSCPTSGGCVETCMKAPVEKTLGQRGGGCGEQANLEYCR
jgi:hypothetical protein